MSQRLKPTPSNLDCQWIEQPPNKTIDNFQMDNTAKTTPITSGIIQHGQNRKGRMLN